LDRIGGPEVTVSTVSGRAHGPGSPIHPCRAPVAHAERQAAVQDETGIQLPIWSPRVSKSKIRQLYTSFGKGIVDEQLIDDVGFSLLARCESVLAATQAGQGAGAPCPRCTSLLDWVSWRNEDLECRSCGWRCPGQVYKKTMKFKHLFAGGMKPFLEEFVREFPRARRHSDRFILIDTLIHRYHWENVGKPSRPGACCLIEGKLKDIMPFLDALSYGERVPEEVQATREQWRQEWRRSWWNRSRS
jgi:Zn ribbon nucleic-acid-binding protein